MKGSRVAGFTLVLVALLALAACTTGNEPSASSAMGDPDSAPLLCSDCAPLEGLVAGGESLASVSTAAVSNVKGVAA